MTVRTVVPGPGWVLLLAAVVPAAPIPREEPIPRDCELLVLPEGQVAGVTKTFPVTDRLVRVFFHDGKEARREEIVAGSSFFFDIWGGHRIVNGRYVVTYRGGIIDLRAKKIVRDAGLESPPFRIGGGRVVYAGKGVKVTAFDFERGREVRLPRLPPWAEGKVGTSNASPDGTRWFELRAVARPAGADPKDSAYSVEIRGEGKPVSADRILTARFLHPGDILGSLPTVWLDDDTLVSQAANGELVTVSAADGSVRKLVTIPVGPPKLDPGPIRRNPQLFREPDGRILYRCDKDYLIDPRKKTWEAATWRPLGHGFEYEPADPIPKLGFRVRYAGREIGRAAFVPPYDEPHRREDQTAAAPGHLAILDFRERGAAGRGRPRIWTVGARGWKTLDLDTNAVIGWVPVRSAK